MALTAFKLGKEQEIMTKNNNNNKTKNPRATLLKKSSSNQHKFHGGPDWFLLVRAGMLLVLQGTNKHPMLFPLPSMQHIPDAGDHQCWIFQQGKTQNQHSKP